MNILGVENAGFVVPEVAVFEVDHVPATHQEWSEQLRDFSFADVFGSLGQNAIMLSREDKSYSMARCPDEGIARDWWAADHMWHPDGIRWERQPDFTVIGCHEAEEGAPTTDLLDTAKLLEITYEDGFWEQHGIDEAEVGQLRSVFLESSYKRDARPFLETFMSEIEKAALEEIYELDLASTNSKTFEEHLAALDAQYPPDEFPLVRISPLSSTPSLFIDGGGKNTTIVGPDGIEHTDALRALRLTYLSGDAPEYYGLTQSIDWKPNKCAIFPQIGTLHRANPGNDCNRVLQLGFLSRPD